MRKRNGISPNTTKESLNWTHGPCKSSRSCTLKIIIFFNLFWLLRVFIAAPAFSSCGGQGLALQLGCLGFSCCRVRATGQVDISAWQVGSVCAAPVLQSMGSIVVAPRLHYSGACAMFPDQGPNLHVLQADSLPVSQQGSPPFHAFSNGVCFSLEDHLQRVLEPTTDEWLTYLPSKDAWVTTLQYLRNKPPQLERKYLLQDQREVSNIQHLRDHQPEDTMLQPPAYE